MAKKKKKKTKFGMEEGKQRVVLLTGFLGSGKTHLLGQLLRDARDSAVVETEYAISFGLEGEDQRSAPKTESLESLESLERASASASSSSRQRLYELERGCVCCDTRGELAAALHSAAQALRDKPTAGKTGKKVLVELTGTVVVGSVIEVVQSDALLSLQHVIAVVDCAGHSAAPESLLQHQILSCNVVALSKTDLVDAQRIEAVKAMIASINPAATVLCNWEITAARLDALPMWSQPQDPLPRPTHPQLHWYCAFAEDVMLDVQLLTERLRNFIKNSGAVRVKGQVYGEDGRVYFVQGVRDFLSVKELRAAPEGEQRVNRVAVIFSKQNDVQYDQPALERLLYSCMVTLESTKNGKRLRIGPVTPDLHDELAEAVANQFQRERVCKSYPEDQQKDMTAFMYAFAKQVMEAADLSSFARCIEDDDAKDKPLEVAGFCLCDIFDPTTFDAHNPGGVGAPIHELLNELEVRMQTLMRGEKLVATTHCPVRALPSEVKNQAM